MGRSGMLEITLSSVDASCTETTAPFPDQPPGRYVRFEVRDTGTEMDEETRRRVFGPFFTTKPIGEGTGLGLSSVLGAVTQNAGFIRVESQLGVGTTFISELPEVDIASKAGAETISVHDMSRGDEMLILAEDEDGVRDWVGRVLRDLGYTVLEARTGDEALQFFVENAADVRLVLTDLVMPDGTGERSGKEWLSALPMYPSSTCRPIPRTRSIAASCSRLPADACRNHSHPVCWRNGCAPRSTARGGEHPIMSILPPAERAASRRRATARL